MTFVLHTLFANGAQSLNPPPMAASRWPAAFGWPGGDAHADSGGVEFWSNPEHAGWLMKQGEYIKTWRRRWFVLKQGKLFWFKDDAVTCTSVSRGVVDVASCCTVKGAEDVINRDFAFEISTRFAVMYFIADSEREKDEWVNSIGRSIVLHSQSITDDEVLDYDTRGKGRLES